MIETIQKISIRNHKLPAELVVWLVIGMGLYRDRPITDVVSKLDLTLSTQKGDTLAASSIAQARQRLTDAPLSELFTSLHNTGLKKKMPMTFGIVCGYLQ